MLLVCNICLSTILGKIRYSKMAKLVESVCGENNLDCSHPKVSELAAGKFVNKMSYFHGYTSDPILRRADIFTALSHLLPQLQTNEQVDGVCEHIRTLRTTKHTLLPGPSVEELSFSIADIWREHRNFLKKDNLVVGINFDKSNQLGHGGAGTVYKMSVADQHGVSMDYVFKLYHPGEAEAFHAEVATPQFDAHNTPNLANNFSLPPTSPLRQQILQHLARNASFLPGHADRPGWQENMYWLILPRAQHDLAHFISD